VLSTTRDYGQITDKLGQTYEISLNTYKPYACGIVIHPTIDACVQLRNEHHLEANQIERIDLGVHPLVLELTGKKEPRTGLEGKFSVYFAAALAIVRGSAGMRDFSDENVRDPRIVALRDRVTATVDPAIKEEQVRARVVLKDGRTLEKRIDHVIGSLERPLSDGDLEAKFTALVEGILPAARARTLMDRCWKIETLPRAGDLAAAARPS
jgi:2-methylcitrate dehydratase PrpD